jgi:hypothetical protein
VRRVIFLPGYLTGFCKEPQSKNSRRLKVSYQSVPSQEPYRVLPPKPFPRLQGRWLDKAGFAVDANVHVQVEPGRPVLEVIDPQAEIG